MRQWNKGINMLMTEVCGQGSSTKRIKQILRFFFPKVNFKIVWVCVGVCVKEGTLVERVFFSGLPVDRVVLDEATPAALMLSLPFITGAHDNFAYFHSLLLFLQN